MIPLPFHNSNACGEPSCQQGPMVIPGAVNSVVAHTVSRSLHRYLPPSSPLFRESQHSGVNRVYVVTPRNPFPSDGLVPWLQGFTHGGPLQYACHLPATRPTRPPQDQTPAVHFHGKI